VIETVDVQSHTIFIGAVKAIELWQQEIVPLVYLDGRFDTVGGGRQTKDAPR
jgi:flavin reductase (DIM6/NTAB) family NADH-FMN oxidoreductase RutF